MRELIHSWEGLNLVVGMQLVLRPYSPKAFSVKLSEDCNLNTRGFVRDKNIKKARNIMRCLMKAQHYFQKKFWVTKLVNWENSKLRITCLDMILFLSNIKNEKELFQRLNNPKLTTADKTDELSFSPREMSKTDKELVITERDC